MNSQYLPFADWLKACGLAIIVWGHVAAATTGAWTPPVYPKQLGVTFFVFVTAFTLAGERRPSPRVIYNRYFEVFLFGLLFAILMSAVGLFLWSDLSESNYLPLTFGLNVLVNDFPANPTTWYIGSYLHILLLWALVFRRLRIELWMVIAVCLAEIVIRSALIQTYGRFVAYMLASNWLTVFVVGLACGQTRRSPAPDKRVAWGLGLALFIAWPIVLASADWKLTFPFMSLTAGDTWRETLLVSIAISILYVSYTLAAYRMAATLKASEFVRFIARNTVFIFVAHMPVYYLLEHVLQTYVRTYSVRVTIEFLVCLLGLAVVSEAVRRILKPNVLRDRLAETVSRRFRSTGVPAVP